MHRPPPHSKHTDTLLPYTTLFRSLRSLFENPTLSAFASLPGDPLDTPASTWSGVPRHSRLPLSFEQQRLWFLEQLSAGGGERSEEHTSELQSLMRISYAVFCLKKKRTTYNKH